MRIISDRFPALDERQMETVMKYFGDALAQCRKTKHLIMGFQFSIDDVLRYVQGNLESLESIEISENPSKKYSLGMHALGLCMPGDVHT